MMCTLANLFITIFFSRSSFITRQPLFDISLSGLCVVCYSNQRMFGIKQTHAYSAVYGQLLPITIAITHLRPHSHSIGGSGAFSKVVASSNPWGVVQVGFSTSASC